MSKGVVDKGSRRQKVGEAVRSAERQARDTKIAMSFGLPGRRRDADARRWSRMQPRDRELSMLLIRFKSVA